MHRAVYTVEHTFELLEVTRMQLHRKGAQSVIAAGVHESSHCMLDSGAPIKECSFVPSDYTVCALLYCTIGGNAYNCTYSCISIVYMDWNGLGTAVRDCCRYLEIKKLLRFLYIPYKSTSASGSVLGI